MPLEKKRRNNHSILHEKVNSVIHRKVDNSILQEWRPLFPLSKNNGQELVKKKHSMKKWKRWCMRCENRKEKKNQWRIMKMKNVRGWTICWPWPQRYCSSAAGKRWEDVGAVGGAVELVSTRVCLAGHVCTKVRVPRAGLHDTWRELTSDLHCLLWQEKGKVECGVGRRRNKRRND